MNRPVEIVQSWDGTRWSVAIPSPFWVRSWRTLFRWKRACHACGADRDRAKWMQWRFKTQEQYENHWISFHYNFASREQSTKGTT